MRAGSLYSSILGVLAWACVSAGAAHAQAPSALSWVREAGAEACIGAPELGARVERLVGPVLVAAPAAEVSVEGRIARKGRRFVATIVVSDARGAVLGVREVKGGDPPAGQEPDCRALDDQLAFVIAVAIDPNAALAELPGELAPDDPGAELLEDLRAHPPQPASFAHAERTEPPKAPTAPERPRDRWRLIGALGAGVDLGALPAPNGHALLEAGLGLAWFTQRLRASLAGSQTVPVEDARATLSWLELGASSCAELLDARGVALELCAGATFARLAAVPEGFSGNPQRRWLLGPRGEARLALQLAGPLWAAVEGALWSAWPKHRLAYDSFGRSRQVHEVPALSGSLVTLLEVRWSP